MPDEKSAIYLDDERNIRFAMIPVADVEPNEWNPNEMSSHLMNALVKDMGELGMLQPILVVPNREEGRAYRIIDGEHRYEGAKLVGDTHIPAIIVEHGVLTENEDAQKFQTVRMNHIRGKINKRKLREMVEDLVERHSIDVIAEQFGFEDSDVIDEMIRDARESLPTEELRREFDKARDEVKTVDDLTILLNRLFSTYGETLDYGYMILDYGGRDHIWVRLTKKSDFDFVKERAKESERYGYSFPSVLLKALADVGPTFFDRYKNDLEAVRDE